jgi:translation initiation factor IF-2
VSRSGAPGAPRRAAAVSCERPPPMGRPAAAAAPGSACAASRPRVLLRRAKRSYPLQAGPAGRVYRQRSGALGGGGRRGGRSSPRRPPRRRAAPPPAPLPRPPRRTPPRAARHPMPPVTRALCRPLRPRRRAALPAGAGRAAQVAEHRVGRPRPTPFLRSGPGPPRPASSCAVCWDSPCFPPAFGTPIGPPHRHPRALPPGPRSAARPARRRAPPRPRVRPPRRRPRGSAPCCRRADAAAAPARPLARPPRGAGRGARPNVWGPCGRRGRGGGGVGGGGGAAAGGGGAGASGAGRERREELWERALWGWDAHI